MAKLYLVHFLGMQSRPWLQDGVVGVVINFLARQRCMRRHDTSPSNRRQSH